MKIYQGTLCSLLVVAGLVAAAIDTADVGPGAVQVITLDTGGQSLEPMALRPAIALIHEFAPQSRVEILERVHDGAPTGLAYILVRHPDHDYLEDANAGMHASGRWEAALGDLQVSGCSFATTDLLLNRTPD